MVTVALALLMSDLTMVQGVAHQASNSSWHPLLCPRRCQTVVSVQGDPTC